MSRPPSYIRRRRRLMRQHIEAQSNLCHWCKEEMSAPNQQNTRSATLEHLVERAAGGEDTLENTRAACKQCNNGRHTREHAARVIAAWEGLGT